MAELVLFTIGHSNHSLEHFMDLIHQHHIEVVCDVRSMPYSRYTPHFNGKNLEHSLEDADYGYVFLGKELGARSENSACYVEGKARYKLIAQDDLFQAGIARLSQGIRKYRVALMCAEKDPMTCHRAVLVGREMRRITGNIQHILADGSLESNESMETRMMDTLKIAPDLLGSRESCI